MDRVTWSSIAICCSGVPVGSLKIAPVCGEYFGGGGAG